MGLRRTGDVQPPVVQRLPAAWALAAFIAKIALPPFMTAVNLLREPLPALVWSRMRHKILPSGAGASERFRKLAGRPEGANCPH